MANEHRDNLREVESPNLVSLCGPQNQNEETWRQFPSSSPIPMLYGHTFANYPKGNKASDLVFYCNRNYGTQYYLRFLSSFDFRE